MPSAGLASGSVVLPGDSGRFLCGDGSWQTPPGGGASTGDMKPWPVATPPSGWLLCDGSAVSRTTYAALFALLGTAYGAGDGSTTFNLPNAKGRVLVGQDAAQVEFDTIGETGGAKTVAAAGSVAAPTFTGSPLGTHDHGVGTMVPSAHAGTAVADHAAGVTGAHSGSAQKIGTSTASAAPSPHTHSTPALVHAVTQPNAHTMSGRSEAVSAGTPAGTVSAPAFTGTPTSVLPPYLVVGGWVIKS